MPIFEQNFAVKKISPSKWGHLGLNKYKLALEGGIGNSKFIFV